MLGCFSIKTTHQVIDDFQNKRTAGAPSHILSIFQLSLKNITISSFNYVHQERNADMGPLSVIMRHKQEHDTEIFKYVFFFQWRRKTEVFVGRNNIVIKYVFIVHCGVR